MPGLKGSRRSNTLTYSANEQPSRARWIAVRIPQLFLSQIAGEKASTGCNKVALERGKTNLNSAPGSLSMKAVS